MGGIYILKKHCHVCVNLVLRARFVFVLPAASDGKAPWNKKDTSVQLMDSQYRYIFPFCSSAVPLFEVRWSALLYCVWSWSLVWIGFSELTDCSLPQKQAPRTN